MKILIEEYRGERIDKVRTWKTHKFLGIKIRLPKTQYVLVGPFPLLSNSLKELKEWIDEIKDNVENL